MKVYLVEDCCSESTIAVFSTEEKADEFIKEHRVCTVMNIAVYELDNPDFEVDYLDRYEPVESK